MTTPSGKSGETDKKAFRNPAKQPLQETVLMPPDEVLKSLAEAVRKSDAQNDETPATPATVILPPGAGNRRRSSTELRLADAAADDFPRPSSDTDTKVRSATDIAADLRIMEDRDTEIRESTRLSKEYAEQGIGSATLPLPPKQPETPRKKTDADRKPDARPAVQPSTQVVTEDQPPPSPRGRSGVTRVNPMVVLDRMGLLLQLQRRARTADADEIPFILVNESRQLLPYRQSALFTIRRGAPVLAAVSGLAVADKTAPYAQWLAKFVGWRLKDADSRTIQRLDFTRMTTTDQKNPPKWLFDWKDFVPRHLLWAPLTAQGGRLSGVLLFFREEAFNESETMFGTHLVESYSQSMALGQVKRFKGEKTRFPWLPILALAALACLFIPVRQSLLAPAEVTARRPALVRSGLEGVVDKILVEPNQYVEEGDPLVRLDDTQLRTRLTVAEKAEDMASAEYRQLMQAALSDPKSKQRIPLVQGRMEQLAAETAYIRSLMERIVIGSPMRGVALCDNPDEWLGRPVSLGQRIMLVADPEDLELEIRLPAAESLPVEPGDELMFFPNVAPVSPMRAKVSFVGYRAGEVPGVGMAYILRADFGGADGLHENEGTALLGLRGMAKLYGPKTPLGMNILRKPITAVRQWLGK